ncbi:hypothetical protein G6011_00236 [Alternaria panax]|uniref:Uncharacterized protein n=1 Tax=Alternaria panax TaxID=48097 RepID=A0AAD4IHS9_9PLEO|nr:hypothetical protein G6011_00236 [Alternaria panax]
MAGLVRRPAKIPHAVLAMPASSFNAGVVQLAASDYGYTIICLSCPARTAINSHSSQNHNETSIVSSYKPSTAV